jgi:hypothetical protein
MCQLWGSQEEGKERMKILNSMSNWKEKERDKKMTVCLKTEFS